MGKPSICVCRPLLQRPELSPLIKCGRVLLTSLPRSPTQHQIAVFTIYLLAKVIWLPVVPCSSSYCHKKNFGVIIMNARSVVGDRNKVLRREKKASCPLFIDTFPHMAKAEIRISLPEFQCYQFKKVNLAFSTIMCFLTQHSSHTATSHVLAYQTESSNSLYHST